MALPGVSPGSPARISPQQVDSTPELDTSQPLPQNMDVAKEELRGWIAKRVAARQVGPVDVPDAPPKTNGTQAAVPPALQALTNIRASLDKLEGALKGMPQSMRETLVNSFATGQPPPPSLQAVADLATQTGQAVTQQMMSLPPDQQANVQQLLNLEQAYPRSNQLLDAMPAPGTGFDAGTAAAPPPTQLPGAMGQALNQMGMVDSPPKLEQLLAAAKRDGISPEQMVDALISGKGPLAQALGPRLNIPQLQNLGMHLTPDPKNPQAYMGRLDGLQKLATQMAGSGPKVPGLMSADDMKQMIASGRNPRDIAQALITGQGPPPRSAMTLDAINALQSAMTPTGTMTAQDRAAFNAQNDALFAMTRGLPATAYVLPGTLPGVPGAAPITALPMSGPATAFTPGQNPLGQTVQGAIAAANNGVIPTGNTSLDLANSVANSMAFSPAEQALLNQIQDPQQRAMQMLQMFMQKQSLLATMLSNLANMRHEMLKTVANNLRA